MDVVDVRPALVTYTVSTDVVPTVKDDAATIIRLCAVLPKGRVKLHAVEITGSV